MRKREKDGQKWRVEFREKERIKIVYIQLCLKPMQDALSRRNDYKCWNQHIDIYIYCRGRAFRKVHLDKNEILYKNLAFKDENDK